MIADQEKEIRIGVVGTGHLGRYHIECIQRIEGFSLSGVFDIDQTRAEEISTKYNTQSFSTLDELIDSKNLSPCIDHAEKA